MISLGVVVAVAVPVCVCALLVVERHQRERAYTKRETWWRDRFDRERLARIEDLGRVADGARALSDTARALDKLVELTKERR